MNPKIKSMPPIHRQSGYVLVLVTVFLIILAGSTIQFFNRTAENTQIAGMYRDNTASLLIAESALDFLTNSFHNGLHTGPAGGSGSCTGTNATDRCRAAAIQQNMNNPTTQLLPYSYYVADTASATPNRISENQASILQNIASSEAKKETGSTLINGQVPVGSLLRVSSLFVNANQHPLLFSTNQQTGILTRIQNSNAWNNEWTVQNSADWNALDRTIKAAAWLEFTQNASDSNAVDIYAQSVAQVGDRKSYTQKYVGSYYNSTVLGTLPVLAESKP
ncbi:MAG: hypothetical protein OEZ68_20015 [Gammaproteobacteria bacterium]|nr:hypothetical protein [Gammaproteobacteria bacterium]MDH5803095.1 hypothetical protein [Gammaproteobacteria bacterium]